MPISEYYKGSGSEVMKDMKSRYGADKGKEVFYATANKRGMNRPGKHSDSSKALDGLKKAKPE